MKQLIKNNKGYQKDIMSFLGNNFPHHTAEQIQTFTQHCPRCCSKFAVQGTYYAFCSCCEAEFASGEEILREWVWKYTKRKSSI